VVYLRVAAAEVGDLRLIERWHWRWDREGVCMGKGRGKKTTHNFGYFGGGVILRWKLFLVDVRVRCPLVFVAL
jgi:hypothetical protein